MFFWAMARESQKLSLPLGQPQGCTGASLGVALEQETILGLSGHCPIRLLAPSLIDFQGNPGIRVLYQAIGIPMFALETPKSIEKNAARNGENAATSVESAPRLSADD